MEVSKLENHMNNQNLLFDVVQKLPKHMKFDCAWFKLHAGSITIKTLIKWLYNQAEAISDVLPLLPVKSVEPKIEKWSKGFYQNTHVEVNHKSRNETSSPASNCSLCGGCSHPTEKWPRFSNMSIKERRDVVVKGGSCVWYLINL